MADVTMNNLETPLVPHAETHKRGIKEQLKSSRIEHLTTHSLVLALQATQVFIAMLILFVITLFEVVVDDLFNTFFWIGILVGAIYIVFILTVHLLKARLRNSSSCFLFVVGISTCEGVLLGYLSLLLSASFVFWELVITAAGLYLGAGTALVLKRSYNRIWGRISVLCGTILAFVIIAIFKERDELVLMAVVTAGICVYLYLIVTKAVRYVNKIAGEETIISGVYIQLLLARKKALWVLKIVTLSYICCRKTEEPQMNAEHKEMGNYNSTA